MTEPLLGMTQREDVGFKMVTCKDCGHHYQCTPSHDYYNYTTAEDGVCWGCLMKSHGLSQQPEPGYE